jgi:hypothetical protein
MITTKKAIPILISLVFLKAKIAKSGENAIISQGIINKK